MPERGEKQSFTPVPPPGKAHSRYKVTRVPFGFDVSIEVRFPPESPRPPDDGTAVLFAFGHLYSVLELSGFTQTQILELLEAMGS